MSLTMSKFLSQTLVILALFLGVTINQQDVATPWEQRIFTCFNSCKIFSFPFVVSIGVSPDEKSIGPAKLPLCTGSLISDQWVLTAAKCVHKKDPTKQMMTAGSHFDVYNCRFLDPYSQHKPSTLKISYQPVITGVVYEDTVNYKSDKDCDLGLLKAQAPFSLINPSYINLAVLPNTQDLTHNLIKRGSKITVVGFGEDFNSLAYNMEHDDSFKCMKCAWVAIDNDVSGCEETWQEHPFASDETVFCMKHHNELYALYPGDDGGPVVWTNQTTKNKTLIGVVSLYKKIESKKKNKVTFVAAFTSVSKYYTFISRTTGLQLPFESAPKPFSSYVKKNFTTTPKPAATLITMTTTTTEKPKEKKKASSGSRIGCALGFVLAVPLFVLLKCK